MALLNLLTPDIIAERFYTLPEELQAALEDKDHQREIQIACITNGIGDPEELRSAEAIMAAVFLGLTHMDDLGATLAEELSLDKQDAEKIAADVRTKVFEPFRKNIEKIYSPIAPGAKKKIEIPSFAPAKIMDISSPASSAMSAKAPMAPSPMSVIPMPTAPKAPMPTTMPAMMPKAPLPTAPIKEEPKGWQPTKLPVSGPTPSTNATPISTATPAPFMMHQESSASQMTAASDFKLNISKDMFKSGPTKQIDIPRPPKAAELEIGKAPLPPKPAGNVSFRTSPLSQSRVVHYTDLRTGMAPGFPTAQPMPKITPTASAPVMPAAKPAVAPVLKTMSAPVPPAPMAPSMPKPPEPIKMAIPPSAPMPVAPAPMGQTTSPTTPAIPTTPTPAKPPKVVNFGPEEVK